MHHPRLTFLLPPRTLHGYFMYRKTLVFLHDEPPRNYPGLWRHHCHVVVA